MKSVHVSIEGRVQGVWFRAWTTEQAKKRWLDGWVRNCTDGTLKAVFSGEDTEVDAPCSLPASWGRRWRG